jgi:ribose transport system permease protein
METDVIKNSELITKKKSGFVGQGSLLKELVPFLGLIFVIAFFAIMTDGRNLSPRVLQIIVLQSVIPMIGAIGVAFTISNGSLDFSLGGIVGMSATFGGIVGASNPYLALPICIIVGVIAGFAVAGIHIVLKIPSFVVSLAMMFLGRGITALITSKMQISAPSSLAWLDEPVFYFIFLLAFFIICFILFEYTKIGKYNKAMGSNYTAAVTSGVPINKYKLIAFSISGVALGICAFLNMIRGGGVGATTGSGFEIDILISLVLGGISITGGSSVRLRGAVIGALILAFLDNGLIMLSVAPSLIGAIKGAVFLLAVSFAYDRKTSRFII